MEQIKHLRYHYGVRQIQFYDDTFTVAKQTVIDFCRRMIADKVDVTWIAFIRGDCFSREIAQLLRTRVTGTARIAIAHTASGGELLQCRMKHSAPEAMFKALMKVANFPKLIFDPTVFNPGLKSSEGCGRKIIFL